MELIPTTSYIKNFNVFYEEVIAEEVDDDFIVIDSKSSLRDIEVTDAKIVSDKKVEDDQFALSFDMPLAKKADQIEDEDEKEHVFTFSLDEEVNELEVNDPVEVTPSAEYNKKGDKRYSLGDYMELERRLTGAKSEPKKKMPKVSEDEIRFERKTVKKDEIEPVTDQVEGEIDPLETPIEDLLKARADERRRKLKDFNYKFQNNRNRLEEIEKVPAYKRQGIDLNENSKEGKISRTSLGEDSNDEMQLRSNNSFLHDNVD